MVIDLSPLLLLPLLGSPSRHLPHSARDLLVSQQASVHCLIHFRAQQHLSLFLRFAAHCIASPSVLCNTGTPENGHCFSQHTPSSSSFSPTVRIWRSHWLVHQVSPTLARSQVRRICRQSNICLAVKLTTVGTRQQIQRRTFLIVMCLPIHTLRTHDLTPYPSCMIYPSAWSIA